MNRTRLRRPAATALLAVTCAAAAFVATAAPTSAASAKSTTYDAHWTFTGGVQADLGAASRTRLVDYAGTTYYDRVLAEPEAPESMTVERQLCEYGTAYQSSINLYGRETGWANMPIGGVTGARLMIACLYPDGTHHRFHWGAYRKSNGHYVSPSTNCLVLERVDETTFSVRTPDGEPCDAQDEIVDPKPSKQISSSTRPIPFAATVTLSGAPPVRR